MTILGYYAAFLLGCLVQTRSARGLSSIGPRTAWSTSKVSFAEVDIDGRSSKLESEGETIGERIRSGESVVELRHLVSPGECDQLARTCLAAADAAAATRRGDKPGLVRLPTIAAAERAAATKTPCADPLPTEVDAALRTIMQRAAEYVDEQLSSLPSVLFQTHSLARLLDHHDLKFSSREPAINVYSAGGKFLAHEDAQALTLLLPLSCPNKDFAGGGTAFWHQDARGHRVEGPSLVSRPPAGTALLFGGCVTHAGVAVEEGSRVVFVASFSAGNRAVV